VIATDLPHIHGNLLFNVQKNNEYLNPIDVIGTLKERHGFVLCEELDWKNPENALADYSSKEFEVIFLLRSGKHLADSLSRLS